MGTQKRETGKEFIDRILRIDPRPREEREAERAGRAFVNRRAAAPLIEELNSAGFSVNWVSDLRQYADYRKALPILLKWLPLMANTDVKVDIVRRLSVPDAKASALPLFLDEYRRVTDNDGELSMALGNGLEIFADDSIFEDLAPLAEDRARGEGRSFVVLALGKTHDPRAVKILMKLLDDIEVSSSAIIALGKIGAAEARPHIQRFLEHPDPTFRREAKKALGRIETKPKPKSQPRST
jgi:hypothetical protein